MLSSPSPGPPTVDRSMVGSSRARVDADCAMTRPGSAVHRRGSWPRRASPGCASVPIMAPPRCSGSPVRPAGSGSIRSPARRARAAAIRRSSGATGSVCCRSQTSRTGLALQRQRLHRRGVDVLLDDRQLAARRRARRGTACPTQVDDLADTAQRRRPSRRARGAPGASRWIFSGRTVNGAGLPGRRPLATSPVEHVRDAHEAGHERGRGPLVDLGRRAHLLDAARG